jgi:hypothetical protein
LRICGLRPMVLWTGGGSGGHLISFKAPPSFILARKLKALKANLRTWNVKVFGKVEYCKKLFWRSCMFLMA